MRPSTAGELLAQDFELQPLLLGRSDLPLRFAEVGGDFLEAGAVAGIEMRIVELGLQFTGFGMERGNGFRQRFERVLVLEFHPALRGRRRGDAGAALW